MFTLEYEGKTFFIDDHWVDCLDGNYWIKRNKNLERGITDTFGGNSEELRVFHRSHEEPSPEDRYIDGLMGSFTNEFIEGDHWFPAGGFDIFKGVYIEPVSKSNPKSTSKQEGGDHYKGFAIQPIEYIVGNNLSYCEGNVIKYVTRHAHKNGAEDIRKAIHYLEMILEDYDCAD